MTSRMRLRDEGKFFVWNYWDPAGPWDYKPGGRATKHWVGVHPNGGYYQCDAQGIVAAYEHGLANAGAGFAHIWDNSAKRGSGRCFDTVRHLSITWTT